jgi:ABC-type sugar transport system ATPase subunit
MELYNRPANLFVAGFIGSPAINLADGAVDTQGVVRMAGVDTGVRLPQHAGQAVKVGVRPEDMLVQPEASANSLTAKVTLVEPTGAESYVLVGGAFGEFTLRSAGEATYSPGAPLHLGFSADKVHVFDAAGGQRLN